MLHNHSNYFKIYNENTNEISKTNRKQNFIGYFYKSVAIIINYKRIGIKILQINVY